MDGYNKHILRYILFPRWHGRGLVITSCDIFCVLTGIGGVWSTHVEIELFTFIVIVSD